MGLTMEQVAKAAFDAGWRGRDGDWATIVAIVKAENQGLDPAATNRNRNGSIDYGLAQINSVHGIPIDKLVDPVGNLTAAKVVHGKQGFKAWTQYGNGAYRQYLDEAKKATNAVELGLFSEVSPENAGLKNTGVLAGPMAVAEKVDPLNLLGKVGDLIGIITDPSWWKRLGVGAAGFLLIAVAGILLLRELALPAPGKAAGAALKGAT